MENLDHKQVEWLDVFVNEMLDPAVYASFMDMGHCLLEFWSKLMNDEVVRFKKEPCKIHGSN